MAFMFFFACIKHVESQWLFFFGEKEANGRADIQNRTRDWCIRTNSASAWVTSALGGVSSVTSLDANCPGTSAFVNLFEREFA